MARDDYHVIVCRILVYLYSCLKNGEKPSLEYFPVGKDYWQYIWSHIFNDGYIEGVELISIMGESMKAVKLTENVSITPKGIEYLQENTPMKKAMGFLKDLKETIPGL